MSTARKQDKPHLAELVLRARASSKQAVAITDFIFMVHDISNAYLVTTADGDVMVNTGFMDDRSAQQGACWRRTAPAPLRAIILTQSHADHYGAIDSFLESRDQGHRPCQFHG